MLSACRLRAISGSYFFLIAARSSFDGFVLAMALIKASACEAAALFFSRRYFTDAVRYTKQLYEVLVR